VEYSARWSEQTKCVYYITDKVMSVVSCCSVSCLSIDTWLENRTRHPVTSSNRLLAAFRAYPFNKGYTVDRTDGCEEVPGGPPVISAGRGCSERPVCSESHTWQSLVGLAADEMRLERTKREPSKPRRTSETSRFLRNRLKSFTLRSQRQPGRFRSSDVVALRSK